MRCWLGFPLLLCAGVAHGQPEARPVAPTASHFDLARSMPRASWTGSSRHAFAHGRWAWHDLEAPAAPARDPPRLRIHGKQLRLRIPID